MPCAANPRNVDERPRCAGRASNEALPFFSNCSKKRRRDGSSAEILHRTSEPPAGTLERISSSRWRIATIPILNAEPLFYNSEFYQPGSRQTRRSGSRRSTGRGEPVTIICGASDSTSSIRTAFSHGHRMLGTIRAAMPRSAASMAVIFAFELPGDRLNPSAAKVAKHFRH